MPACLGAGVGAVLCQLCRQLGNLETQGTAGAEKWGGRGWETSVSSGFPVFLPMICQNKFQPPADQNVSEGEKKKILQKLKKKNTATNMKPESFPCLDLTHLRWTRSKSKLSCCEVRRAQTAMLWSVTECSPPRNHQCPPPPGFSKPFPAFWFH